MSVELIGVLIAVVAVGATLAGLMLSGQRAIRAELAEQRREFRAELAEQRQEFRAELAAQRQYFDERFAALEQRLSALEQRLSALEQQMTELRERMAHLEGLLDGLREAIASSAGQQPVRDPHGVMDYTGLLRYRNCYHSEKLLTESHTRGRKRSFSLYLVCRF